MWKYIKRMFGFQSEASTPDSFPEIHNWQIGDEIRDMILLNNWKLRQINDDGSAIIERRSRLKKIESDSFGKQQYSNLSIEQRKLQAELNAATPSINQNPSLEFVSHFTDLIL